MSNHLYPRLQQLNMKNAISKARKSEKENIRELQRRGIPFDNGAKITNRAIKSQIVIQLDATTTGTNKGRYPVEYSFRAIKLFARLGADGNFTPTANHVYNVRRNGNSIGTITLTAAQGPRAVNLLNPAQVFEIGDRITIDKDSGPSEGTNILVGLLIER